MKAIRTVEGEMVNPAFSHADRRAARNAGVAYEVPEFIVLPIGQELDAADCWQLCCLNLAVPDDEECLKKVYEVVGDSRRQQNTSNLFAMRTAKGNRTLTPSEQRFLDQLERSYALDLKIAEEQKTNALSGMGGETGKPDSGSSDAGSSHGGGGSSSENATEPAKDTPGRKGKA